MHVSSKSIFHDFQLSYQTHGGFKCTWTEKDNVAACLEPGNWQGTWILQQKRRLCFCKAIGIPPHLCFWCRTNSFPQLSHPEFQFLDMDRLQDIVANDRKHRFTLEFDPKKGDDTWWIKAKQWDVCGTYLEITTSCTYGLPTGAFLGYETCFCKGSNRKCCLCYNSRGMGIPYMHVFLYSLLCLLKRSSPSPKWYSQTGSRLDRSLPWHSYRRVSWRLVC